MDDPPGTKVGFVELWNGSERSIGSPLCTTARTELTSARATGLSRCNDRARSFEYRFYVNAGVNMTLERVELFSGLAIPPRRHDRLLDVYLLVEIERVFVNNP